MVKKQSFYTDLHKYKQPNPCLDGKFVKYTKRNIVSQDDQMTLLKTIKIFDFIFLK